jgi:hypothetical protein
MNRCQLALVEKCQYLSLETKRRGRGVSLPNVFMSLLVHIDVMTCEFSLLGGLHTDDSAVYNSQTMRCNQTVTGTYNPRYLDYVARTAAV